MMHLRRTGLPAWRLNMLLSIGVVGAFVVTGYAVMSSFVYHWLIPVEAGLTVAGLFLIWWPVLQPLRPVNRILWAAVCLASGVLLLGALTSGWPELQVFDGPGSFTEGVPVWMSLIVVGASAMVLFVPLALFLPAGQRCAAAES